MDLEVGKACEVLLVIAGGRGGFSSWTKGYIVKEVGPVIRVLELARGHVVNYPPTHVRPVFKSRQVEIAARHFDAMVAAYTRKGWTIIAQGHSSVEVERGHERITLLPRLGESKVDS